MHFKYTNQYIQRIKLNQIKPPHTRHSSTKEHDAGKWAHRYNTRSTQSRTMSLWFSVASDHLAKPNARRLAKNQKRSSRSTCNTSERNSRPYKINTTKAVAKTKANDEKNQAMAAKEK